MRLLLTFAIALALSACIEGTIKPYNFSEFQPFEIEDDPLASGASENAKLLVVEFDENHGVPGLKLSSKARSQIKQELLNKGVEIRNVEKGLRGKLDDEIKLIEAGGTSNYSLPSAANIALKGEISSATLSQNFSEAYTYKKDDGTTVRVPAKCTYTAEVTGITVFYNINPVKKKKSTKLAGKSSLEKKESSCRGLSDGEKQNLYLKSVNSAVRNGRHALMNVLARKGYVVAAYRRVDKDKPILFRLSLTPDEGAIPGNKLSFFEFREGPNGELEKIPFGEAKVACTSHTNVAYASVKDVNLAERIKVNTPIQLKYSKGMPIFDQLTSLIKCSP